MKLVALLMPLALSSAISAAMFSPGTKPPASKPQWLAIIDKNDLASAERAIKEHPETINEPCMEGGLTPLHSALRDIRGRNQIAGVLVRAGARLDLVTTKGALPIHYAIANDASDKATMVDLLLNAGSPLTMEKPSHDTPLKFAMLLGRKRSIIHLIEAGTEQVSYYLFKSPTISAIPLAEAIHTGDERQSNRKLRLKRQELYLSTLFPLVLAAIINDYARIDIS